MVIPPFYQFLIGTIERDCLKYVFLTRDSRSVSLDMPVRFPSYHAETQTVYGICDRNDKNVIARASLKPSGIEFSPLFALSDKTLSHTAVSPDNQKVAFLATDFSGNETLLRVIAREEFGWFPLPYIKIPAQKSPVCFCGPNAVMYTTPSGTLSAVRLAKQIKTIEISPEGYSPAYETTNGTRVFIKNNNIFIFNKIQTELNLSSPSCTSFSQDGNRLFFADDNSVYSYDLTSKKQKKIFQFSGQITFIAEL